MANTARDDERHNKPRLDEDDDPTLREVGDEHDLGDFNDEPDAAADRRRDPLRWPH